MSSSGLSPRVLPIEARSAAWSTGLACANAGLSKIPAFPSIKGVDPSALAAISCVRAQKLEDEGDARKAAFVYARCGGWLWTSCTTALLVLRLPRFVRPPPRSLPTAQQAPTRRRTQKNQDSQRMGPQPRRTETRLRRASA